ncbi:MAG: hypothetical protein JSR39_10765 [Verrucomicrobia bacterium]|nr:hypothetical protein [Verrucomicrobiota bacterium]
MITTVERLRTSRNPSFNTTGSSDKVVCREIRYPLDALVYETAHTISDHRYTAPDVLMHFSQLDVVDSEENIEPEGNRKKSFITRFFG